MTKTKFSKLSNFWPNKTNLQDEKILFFINDWGSHFSQPRTSCTTIDWSVRPCARISSPPSSPLSPPSVVVVVVVVVLLRLKVELYVCTVFFKTMESLRRLLFRNFHEKCWEFGNLVYDALLSHSSSSGQYSKVLHHHSAQWSNGGGEMEEKRGELGKSGFIHIFPRDKPSKRLQGVLLIYRA